VEPRDATALHVAPALLLAGQPLEQAHGTPPHRELTVAQILDHHRPQQHREVARARDRSETPPLPAARTRRQQQAGAEGEQENAPNDAQEVSPSAISEPITT
jgi:hypothetical protein